MSSSERTVEDIFDERREDRFTSQQTFSSHISGINVDREIILSPGSKVTVVIETEEGTEEIIELSRDAFLSDSLNKDSHLTEHRTPITLNDRPVSNITKRTSSDSKNVDSTKQEKPATDDEDLSAFVDDNYPAGCIVAVDRTDHSEIASASSMSDLTTTLLSMDYNEENTLIIRSNG